MATVPLARPTAFRLPALRVHPGLFMVLAGALHQLRPALDPDLGWHLRTGQLILSTHQIPRTDSFSQTFAGQPWVDFEWLWEAGLAAVWAAGGRLAAVVAVSLLVGAVYGLVYGALRLRGLPPIICAFGVAFCALNLASYADVRPGVSGAFFVALFIFVLELAKARSDPRWLYALVPAEVLWANMHGSFVLGPAIAGLYALSAAWDHLAAGRSFRALGGLALRWALLGGGLLAATLANPLGLGLLRFTLASAALTTNRDFNGEWAAPNFHAVWTLPLLATMLASLALPLASRRVRLPKPEVLMLVCASALVLRNGQFITFYAVAAAPVLATMLRQLLDRPLDIALSPLPSIVLALALAMIGAGSVQSIRPERYDADVAKTFPAEAVSYIDQNQLAGPMWNEFNWGCYLISALPQLPVFIDGRTEMYGDAFFKEYFEAATGSTNPDNVLDKHGINLALVQDKSAIATILRTEPRWREAYHDDLAAVFVRQPG